MNKKILLALLLVVFASNVFALGITPGRTTVDFAPGLEKEVAFTVVNSDSKELEMFVVVQGEFNETMGVSEVSFKLAPGESKDLTYKVKLPNELKPGSHKGEVVVVALPSKSATSEAFVGGTVAVATQLIVNVPYPGKYAETDLSIIGPEGDGTITFVMPIVSRGDLDIVSAKAVIDVYTSLNEKIETLTTNEVAVLSGQRKEVAVAWKADVPPGPYRASATLIYDEQTETIQKEFSVGTRLLEVLGIDVNEFSLGEIAKFETLVENKWSEKIAGAYMQMLIYNSEGAVMADFKSQTYDIDPLTKTLMVAFWDTAGVREGTYDSSIFLRYGQNSEQQDFELKVSNNEITAIGIGYVISSESSGNSGLLDNSLVIILVTIIGVLILVNLLWFLMLRKKLSGKKK